MEIKEFIELAELEATGVLLAEAKYTSKNVDNPAEFKKQLNFYHITELGLRLYDYANSTIFDRVIAALSQQNADGPIDLVMEICREALKSEVLKSLRL